MDVQNQLINLKSLFSKFSALINDINLPHNEKNANFGRTSITDGNIVPELKASHDVNNIPNVVSIDVNTENENDSNLERGLAGSNLNENVQRDVKYLLNGLNVDTNNVNDVNKKPGLGASHNVSYLPNGMNVDLYTRDVNNGNEEPGLKTSHDVNYLPNVDLYTENVNDSNLERGLAGSNLNGNVQRDVKYLLNGLNVDTNNVNDVNKKPGLGASHNVRYLPNGMNVDLYTRDVNNGNEEPGLKTSHDVNYLPNVDLYTENVNDSNLERGLAGSNLNGNVQRDVKYLLNGLNVDTNNVNDVNKKPGLGASHNVRYLPNGMNVDLYTRDVNDGNEEPGLKTSHDVNYLPNVDLYTENVNDSNLERGLAGSNLNGNVIGDLELTTMHTNSHIMNVELPNECSFNESRLQLILNKQADSNLVNYFYYLFDDRNANLDSSTTNFIESAEITETSIDQQYDSLHVESEVIELRDSVTFPFGSTDKANELENVTDMLTERESSNVAVTTSINDSSDGYVVRGNLKTSKHQSPSRNKNEQPCIVIKPRIGYDNTNMFVPTSDGKVKKQCCVYCLKRFSKLVPHLQFVHKNEEAVKEFRDLAPGSKQRRKIIDDLRSKGQFEWNNNPEINCNELMTTRRPNKKFKKAANDFLTCAKCKGLFSGTALRQHWNKCTNNFMKGERVVKVLGRAVEGRYHAEACDDLRTSVFPKMREDECVRSIRFDWLVVTFGNDLCLNYSPHYQQQLIRTNLRKAGKILLAAKSISSEVTDFASLFHVKQCNTVIEAIRKVAQFDHKLKEFKSPGTASTSVTLMNAIGEVLIIESMKLDDQEREKNVERFLKVFQKEAKNKINKIVAVQQSKARRQRKENIPSTDDINLLAKYLDSERDKCFLELSEKFDYKKWLGLGELTIVSILLFNRRRTGEMQNIVVGDFHIRENISDETTTVPQETKNLIKSRMQIRGKLRRQVPVLLKHSYEACIELLLLHRKAAGISDTNDCLFALPTKSKNIKTIDAGAAIRTFSILCGAENPSSLRGTKFRKHMASFCGTLNLSDNDVTNVANFMGHDDQIHRDIYRHNTLEREVVQMTAILEAAQGNRSILTSAIYALIKKVGDKLAKTQKRKELIDLLNESSSEESCDESDAEAEVTTIKSSEKQLNNRTKIATKMNEKPVKNQKRTKAASAKTSESGKTIKRKRSAKTSESGKTTNRKRSLKKTLSPAS